VPSFDSTYLPSETTTATFFFVFSVILYLVWYGMVDIRHVT